MNCFSLNLLFSVYCIFFAFLALFASNLFALPMTSTNTSAISSSCCIANSIPLTTTSWFAPTSFLFQMWFVLYERAFENDYAFKNPKALAAATEYMYKSSRVKNITKKEIAEFYGISPATLTKYVNELIQYLPLFDK